MAGSQWNCSVCGTQNEEKYKVCQGCGTERAQRKIEISPPQKSDEELFQMAMDARYGLTGEKNEIKAERYLEELAARGHLEATYELAILYLRGDHPNRKKGLEMLRMAAKNGHAKSQRRLEMEGVKEQVSVEAVENEQANSVPAQKGEKPFKQLVKEALPYVLRIHAKVTDGKHVGISAGSGFIVRGGLIFTNHHVVQGCIGPIVAEFDPEIDSVVYNLEVVGLLPDVDLAVLRFKGLAAKRMAKRGWLEIADTRPDLGEDVYVIGNPIDIGLSVNKGVVAHNRRQDSRHRGLTEVLQISLSLNHGNSGGCVLNMKNEVVGVATYIPCTSNGETPRPGVGMAIPADVVANALEAAERALAE